MTAVAQKNVDSVILKTNLALQVLDEVQYDQKRIVNEKSVRNYNVYQGLVYYNFKDTSNTLKATYIFENTDYKLIYNGSESFELDKKNKTLKLLENNLATFNSLSFINHSIFSLRNFFPVLLKKNDFITTVRDTIIQSQHYYNLTFQLGQGAIDNLGKVRKLLGKAKMHYSILINPSTFLPIHLKRTNLYNQDQVDVTYTNFKTTNIFPDPKSLYYSSYTTTYKLKMDSDLHLLEKGKQAIKFELEGTMSGQKYLSNYSQYKVTLLEFFIKNCGYCIEAVPELNKLKETYKDKNMQILAINVNDGLESVKTFIANTNPSYDIAIKGSEIAKQFGVHFYPSVVLVNSFGKIIYSGAFDKTAIITSMKREGLF